MNKKRASVAITCSFLLAASTATATFSFSVDSFTDDELVITISGSSTLGGPVPTASGNFFFLADTDGTSSFITSPASITGSSVPGSPLLTSGSSLIFSGATDTFINGEVPSMFFSAIPTIGDTFGTDVEITFAGLGLFDKTQIGGELGLYWGTNDGTGGSFPTPQGGSFQSSLPVPEPSTYAFILAAVSLGFTALRRRR